MPVGLFGEWYGGATVGGAGYTKNSSSIRMTAIRNLSPRSRRRPSCHDAAMMEVINIQRREQSCAQHLRSSSANCGLSGPISSSCVFRKAPRKWFHSRESEITRFACLKARKTTLTRLRYFRSNCSITTHNRRSIVVAAMASTREQLCSEISFRDEVIRVSCLKGESKSRTNCRLSWSV